MKKAYLFLLFVIGCMSHSIAQVTVKGTVVSKADQMPVPGAYIVLKGQAGQGTTTITNFDGQFVIQSKQNKGVVEISSLGYETQIINYAGDQKLEIVLGDLASDLDEIVLIGYGSSKKGDLTSAIGTANNVGTITSRPVSNYKDFLQGNIAGVTVLSSGGDPTKTADIKIRGIGTFNGESPLVVVDGIPYNGPEINPNDIKSISVLKDAASAAIYGAQAASGVIVIETKKGKIGKPRIGVNYYTGIQTATNLPTPLTAKQQADVYNTAADNAGTPRQSAHDASQNPYGQVNRTNWVDAIFRDAKVNNINVDLSGAGKDFNYYTSFAYRNREGLLEGTSSENYNLRVKSDYNLTDKITIGENVYMSRDEAYGTDTDNPYSGTIINAIYMPSASPTRYADGSFSGTAPDTDELRGFAGAYGDTYNPLALLLRPNKKSPRTFTSINAYLKYDVLKGLSFKTNYFYSYSHEEKKEFYGVVPELGRSSTQNSLLEENRTIGKWIWDNQLTYDVAFGKHNINATAIYSAQKTTGDFTSVKGTGFSSEETYNQYLQNAEVILKPTNSPFQDALTSAIARVMYNYGNKYYVSASYRNDESSRLATKNQSDNFSSATLGWRLSKESFFNVDAINDLKLRASWGQIGNIKSVDYYSFDVPIASRNIVLGDNASYTSSGSYVARNGNPDLKWERVESLDFGFDAALLDHSLNITVDYFKKTTKGMIIKGLADLNQGINPADANGGQVKNTGFEVAATYKNKIGAVNYRVNANATSVKNELENLNGYAGIGQVTYDHGDNVRGVLKPYQTRVGGELYTPYLVPHLGIFQNQAEIDAYTKDGNLIQPNAKPGDFKFGDTNNDGKISEQDRKYYDAYQPKLTYNFGLNLDYKGFDLGMIFQGVAGVKAFNGYKYTTYNASLSGYNLDNRVLNAWSPTNTNASIPVLSTKDDNKNFGTASSWYLEDASYLRIKNITLGYTFDKKVMDKVAKGSTLRLYVSGENLATFTDYSGLDPEVGGKGLDVAKYPVARTVSFGLLMSL
ncbi:TonB-linked SusC/RagA family outer membrane protein [Wenyingzhuangia heitensis]|uniref:TonB-linked SusC/RagA family outer membrane protein n=1 Tax=Wenyingzhuangia heitensis TaxID=1487859 RepID=A0ABX0U564_9FLAO|nr:TonB-dependent receptor [Wenyingzhuangia heitensis]NIJ43999.1 TonB-linked SusC/RagA family outer membrane protein [Wenyingzhuangia heitensis]